MGLIFFWRGRDFNVCHELQGLLRPALRERFRALSTVLKTRQAVPQGTPSRPTGTDSGASCGSELPDPRGALS